MSAARKQANCDRSVLDEMIAGLWGNPYGTGLLPSVEPVPVSPLRAAIPLPVDVSNEAEFPHIAEAQRHSRKGVK